MYKYDLFVSYKREPRFHNQLITPWLRKGLDRIEYWLRQELGGRSVVLPIDTKSVEAGDDWPHLDSQGATHRALPDANLVARVLSFTLVRGGMA